MYLSAICGCNLLPLHPTCVVTYRLVTYWMVLKTGFTLTYLSASGKWLLYKPYSRASHQSPTVFLCCVLHFQPVPGDLRSIKLQRSLIPWFEMMMILTMMQLLRQEKWWTSHETPRSSRYSFAQQINVKIIRQSAEQQLQPIKRDYHFQR